MDKTDIAILKILKRNARSKASAISAEIDLSVSSVTERIKKLEEKGIITGYTAILNEQAMGNDVSALMEVTMEHPKYYDSVASAIINHPNVVDCYYLAGDCDFSMKIVCRSSAELEEIHRSIKGLDGVSSTKTHFILKNVKDIYSPEIKD